MKRDRGLLRLYVAGPGPRTEAALQSIRSACDRSHRGRYEVEVVDLAERPDAGGQAGVIVTPTLVRVRPGPERRWIGDFAMADDVALALGSDDV
jgi:circadian clock protein KaiB